ncbi:sialidase family protein [Pedobacter frigiditerrae]|uniref:sialidase family protein n=1 Tax=Pedobacter frigiditerrae TaxID=2530452 RepID=UPI00293142AD|nr:sialidase family protein [Pedobacter frigiditerrae]
MIKILKHTEMKMNLLKVYLIFAVLAGVLLTGCYKEEHFTFPGPFDAGKPINPDSLPFPFDKTRTAGKWLMKNGVPDYENILVKGYTDYAAVGDALSWEQKPDGLHELPHYNFYPLATTDHFAADANSYKYNWIYSKYFVPVGAGTSFYMYAKVTFGTFNGTAAALVLGKNWDTQAVFNFGMDGNSTTGEPKFFLDYYGVTASVDPAQGWPTVNQVMVPGVPADLEVVITNGIFYVKINKILVFTFRMGNDKLQFFTPQIRPWRNFVNVHEMYIESNQMYTMNYAMHEYEKGYNKIQAPALAKAANGNLLLFAEGRSTPTNSIERVAQNTMAVGNTDIIMKRSTDGGNTWDSQIKVIAGDGSNSTFCFPQVVSLASGKIILQYSSINSTVAGTVYTYTDASQKIFQVESSDNGNTWTTPIEVTTVLKDVAAGYVQNGPGHGIELKSTTYNKRLIIPLNYSKKTVKVAISDNGGTSWRLSKVVSGSSLKNASVVELTDGRLMMIVGHTNASPKNKFVSYSSDGGDNWTAAVNVKADVATSDYGHLFPGTVVKGSSGEIFFINSTGRETDTEVKNSPSYPTVPVVFKSTDNGLNYTNAGALFTKTAYFGYAAPFGAMDAVVLDNGTLVIAGEGGVESPTEGIVIYKK